jgi:hypothetical protein
VCVERTMIRVAAPTVLLTFAGTPDGTSKPRRVLHDTGREAGDGRREICVALHKRIERRFVKGGGEPAIHFDRLRDKPAR